MKITKVQLTKGDWGKTKAMVSVTFDDCFVVSGLKVKGKDYEEHQGTKKSRSF